MRNVFAFRTVKGTDGIVSEGEAFITRRLPPAQQGKLDEKTEQASAARKKLGLPLPLRILECVALGVFICCAGGVLENIGSLSFAQMYENAAGVFWTGGICGAVGGALLLAAILRKRRLRSALAQPEAELARAVGEAQRELGIPEDAMKMDIFTEPYRITKRGKRRRANGFCKYANMEMSVYERGECLCIASADTEYSLPKTSFSAIYRMTKSAEFYGWNKGEAFNSPQFKPYKIRANNVGVLYVKPHYSVRLTRGGEEFEFVIPPYELEKLQQFLNLPVL